MVATFAFAGVGGKSPMETTIGSPSSASTMPRIPLSAPISVGPELCSVSLWPPEPNPLSLLISTLGPTTPLCRLDIGTWEWGAGDTNDWDGYAG